MGIPRRSQRMGVCFIYAFVLRRARLMYVGKTFDRRQRERYSRRYWGPSTELDFRVLDVAPPGENDWQFERRWVPGPERAGWKLLDARLGPPRPRLSPA